MTILAMLDVGQGSCAVLHDGPYAVVIDCPPGKVLREYLIHSEISVITDLVVSHADLDHFGGVAPLIRSGIRVERIWMNDEQGNRTSAYLQLAHLFAESRERGAPIPRVLPNSDVAPVVHGMLEFEFLAPNYERRMLAGSGNTNSVVVRVKHDGAGVALIPGDLDLEGLRALRSTDRDWSAKWLVAPHHGGAAGPGPDASATLASQLLRLTEAAHVFMSFGRNSPHQHPQPSLMSALAKEWGWVDVRCSQLSVRCAQEHPSSGGTEPFQSRIGAGSQARQPRSCAGTVVLNLEETAATDYRWQKRHAHDVFVEQFPDRLCLPIFDDA